MKPEHSITEALLHLYELALSIGKQLAPRETCLNFINVLVPRYGLIGASVWWRTGSGQPLQPLAVLPRLGADIDAGMLSDTLEQCLIANTPIILAPGDHHYEAFANGFHGHTLTFGLYPFAERGVLVMQSTQPDVISMRLLKSLRPIMDALGTSIQGGIALEQLALSERELKKQRGFLKTLVNTIPDLVWLKDPDGIYLTCNERFEQFFGATERQIVGKTDYDFVDAELADSFRANDRRAMINNAPTVNEEWIPFASDGHYELLETTKTPMLDEEGALVGVLGVGHDITHNRAMQQQLENLAHYDALTSLPNRILLAERLQQAMAQAQEHGTLLAVAYLDLDGFKLVNDSFGHDTGDQLLVDLSQRFVETLRDGDTIARIGGDEFVVALLDFSTRKECAQVLDRLLAAAAEPIVVNDTWVRVSASVGVTFFPQKDEVDADQLLRQADQAMYQAKQTGKNRYHVFDIEQDRYVRDKIDSLSRIRTALLNQELTLHYQPKVNMRSGDVVGVEALIRWQHPERGLLAPALFLPMIENHRLIIDLGEWVIERALQQIERWQRVGLDLSVSVNVNGYHLQQPDFFEKLHHCLVRHPAVDPARLELEILETSALEDIAHVSHVIQSCQALGIGFALDDFGTGYSSLTYLKRLQTRVLKIDQSFVQDMLNDPDDLAILDGVLGLARSFRKQVIAEGVETLEHGEMLLMMGCELGQGYAIARPMPAQEVGSWLAQWQPDSVWQQCVQARADDRQVIHAMVEHRAWIHRLTHYVRDETPEPPVLDSNNCRLNGWLAELETNLCADQLGIHRVTELHKTLHQQAELLIQQKTHRPAGCLEASLESIQRQHDAFVDALKQLILKFGV